MAKLTKAVAKLHAEAEARAAKDILTAEDKEFIRENWQESANHVNSTAGAFFTPPALARDFAIEVSGSRIIDLCAGIGTLASAIWDAQAWERRSGAEPLEIVCVELNPEYAAIGKKMLPEATWITASIFDLPDMGRFDTAVSNPPFGNIGRGGGQAPRYRGKDFEYHVIDIAAEIADRGAFILPQMSVPFKYSGAPYYEEVSSTKYERFVKQTGVELEAGCGIDTSVFAEEWHGVTVYVEVALADFESIASSIKAQPAEDEVALFELAAA